MTLTSDQQVEFERHTDDLVSRAVAGEQGAAKELAAFGSGSESQRLGSFQAYATTERAREAKAESDADTRVTRDKEVRAARDTILAEIETLARL